MLRMLRNCKANQPLLVSDKSRGTKDYLPDARGGRIFAEKSCYSREGQEGCLRSDPGLILESKITDIIRDRGIVLE